MTLINITTSQLVADESDPTLVCVCVFKYKHTAVLNVEVISKTFTRENL